MALKAFNFHSDVYGLPNSQGQSKSSSSPQYRRHRSRIRNCRNRIHSFAHILCRLSDQLIYHQIASEANSSISASDNQCDVGDTIRKSIHQCNLIIFDFIPKISNIHVVHLNVFRECGVWRLENKCYRCKFVRMNFCCICTTFFIELETFCIVMDL